MNPFPDSQTPSSPSVTRRSPRPSVPVVFLICVVVGLAIGCWRTFVRIDVLRSKARLEATARGVLVEMQFKEAAAVSELLAAVARQNGGAIPNFQKLASECLEAHPGLASLTLEPSGVVRDVFPKTGHERAIGFNVLTDPVQRVGANDAFRKRALTVTGPVTLDTGEPGVILRTPIFVRGRDGRDGFWGFVAVSLRLSDALARARVDDLWTQGYDYVFCAPATGTPRILSNPAHGQLVLADAEQYQVMINDARFTLAVHPRGGWTNKIKMALETVVMFVIAGLFSLLVHVVRSRREVEATVAELTRRLTRETAELNQAREDCVAAKGEIATSQSELAKTRAALEAAKSTIATSQARLEAALRATNDIAHVAQGQSSQAESRVSELEFRLQAVTEAADEAARKAKVEIDRLKKATEQAQQKTKDLEAQLDAEKQGAADAASAAQSRLRKAETSVADLQAHLDAASRSMRDAAETNGAKLSKLDETIRELTARVERAEAEARLAEKAETAEKVKSPEPPEQPELTPPPVVEPVIETPAPVAPPPPPPPTLPLLIEAEAPQASPAEVPEKSAGPAKRKKTRREENLDLFPTMAETVPATTPPKPKAIAEPLNEDPDRPTVPAVAPKAAAKPEVAPVLAEPEHSPTEPKSEDPDSNELLAEDLFDNDSPKIEGLNVKESVRPQGDSDSVLKKMRQFAEGEAQTPEKIRDALVLGNTEAAEQALKSLRSSAESIGSPVIEAASVRLLHAIQAQTDPTEIEFLWADLHKSVQDVVASIKTPAKPKEEKPASARAQRPPPPVNPAQLRKAMHQILPLLAEQDPGAKDCFKDNRETFRSAFAPEAFGDFEQAIKKGDFNHALESLKKTAKRHGISL